MSFVNPINIIKLLISNSEWLQWEPETIWQTLDDNFKNLPKGQPEFPRIFKDIISATKLCMTNDMAWNEWNVFSKVILTFNNIVPYFDIMQKPLLGQLAFGVYILNQIKSSDFSEEVKLYIASAAKHDGYILLPDILRFAQDRLDAMNKGHESKKEEIDLAYKVFKTGNKVIAKNDNNYIVVQATKLIVVDKYVQQLLSK